MSRIRAVILDIDGTLVDSNQAHAQAYVDAAREIGISSPSATEVWRLIGMGGDKLIPRAFGFEQDDPLGAALDERKGNIFRSRYLQTLNATPGARALLERLRDDGYTLVVATSANEEDVKGLLDRAGVTDLIEDSTSGEEVDASKPDPDVVHAALEGAGVGPDAAIMLGDTPYDVEAASRAGVQIIAVRSGGWGDKDLGGAALVFDHPADLLSHYTETPLGA
jgi:HAD superfamily hydrolase (TIGR01509 family)